jgi:hypothetical protein
MFIGYVLQALNLAAWGLLTASGWSLLHDLKERHIDGRPSAEQITYYLAIPALFTSVAAAIALATLVGGRSPKSRIAIWGRRVLLLNLLFLLPFAFFYTGGV